MIKGINIHIPSLVTVVLGPRLGIHIWVVMNERDINSVSSCRCLHEFHIVDGLKIRNFLRTVKPLVSKFILDLIQENIATVGDLVLGNYLRHLVHIRRPSIRVPGVVIAQLTVCPCRNPSWKSAGRGLGVDIWARAEEYIQTNLLCNLEEAFKVMCAILKV